MITTACHDVVARTLFGKTRRAVLGLLYCRADVRFFTREIIRLTGSGEGPVQRELAALTAAGLVTRCREGHQVYYQANRSSPVFGELRSLIAKTCGVADTLRECLQPLADRITAAFVYGSFARGEERAGSDVDVLIVGEVGMVEVARALGPARDALGREVNATVFPRDEYARELAAGGSFVRDVMAKPRITLIGSEADAAGVAT